MNEQKKSLGGNLWAKTVADERQVELLCQRSGLPYLVCRVLAARGVTDDGIDSFLHPKLQNLMPNPSCLKDMDKAAKRLAEAVIAGEKIGVIGDYDVDGATSSSVLRRFLEFFGLTVRVHIPDREEGYGPSFQAFEEFAAQNIHLVVTTDCGTTAFEVLDSAAADGFDILVIDHHEAETRLPKVMAVVNPKRLDEENDYPYLKYLAAVGVVYLLIVAVNRELRLAGYYEKHPTPDLLKLLDLVALGTVCDVVPLLGLNRAYVRQGLKVMSLQQNEGIKALANVAGLNTAPTAFHLGYVLGPRINAGGRVGDASVGNRLLCARDAETAKTLAEELNKFNDERKDIEAYVLLQAIEQLEGAPQKYPMAFVSGTDWHQGVIGIVAGKLKERYNLPAFVMSIEHDEVKGSARSVRGVDLGALIMAAKEKGILTKGGGHIMAAGFSLNEENMEAFKRFAGEYIRDALGEEKLAPIMEIDGVVSLSGANLDLAEKFQNIEPFGAGNPEPRIVIENVKIVRPSVIGSGHVRCFLGGDGGGSLKAIAFRAADNAIGTTLLQAKGERFNVAGQLRKDIWQERTSVQFVIEDMMAV